MCRARRAARPASTRHTRIRAGVPSIGVAARAGAVMADAVDVAVTVVQDDEAAEKAVEESAEAPAEAAAEEAPVDAADTDKA